jgi:hypothetical protein
MKRRTILCEGPVDIVALRAIAKFMVPGAERWRLVDRDRALRAGESKKVMIEQRGALELSITAVDGKSRLVPMLMELLKDLAEQEDHVAIVFDPDLDPPSVQHAACDTALKALAPSWSITESSAPGHVALWKLATDTGLAVIIHSIPWFSSGRTLDDLDQNVQHLERILCEVLARSKPEMLLVVERWLVEMKQVPGAKPCWKSAMHLWCALVDPKQSTASFAERVLGQDDAFRDFAMAVLGETALLDDLRPLLEVSEPV